MSYYQIYAQIKDGDVLNTAVFANYTKANEITKLQYGDTAIAVYCNEYKVCAGCKYIDGTFYTEDGETPCEQNFTVYQCKSQMENLQEQYTSDLAYIAMASDVELTQE